MFIDVKMIVILLIVILVIVFISRRDSIRLGTIEYDFVEIGTSDFDTLIQASDGTLRGLSVEPIKFYLDNLPDKVLVTKVNCAII